MLQIQKVQSEEDIQIFTSLKIELAKYHEQYACMQGILDSEIVHYNKESVYQNIFTRESYLLKVREKVVGILQFEKQISEIDNNPILYVHALYFSEQYQNKAWGIYVLKYLCNTYNMRIECSCWYDIPALKIYEKIGFKRMFTRYILPMDNHFYDSDQN